LKGRWRGVVVCASSIWKKDERLGVYGEGPVFFADGSFFAEDWFSADGWFCTDGSRRIMLPMLCLALIGCYLLSIVETLGSLGLEDEVSCVQVAFGFCSDSFLLESETRPIEEMGIYLCDNP
jgi:hypothetical protein